jgi:hypothetical protein
MPTSAAISWAPEKAAVIEIVDQPVVALISVAMTGNA